MRINKRRLGRNFSRQAWRYDRYARVQRYMAERLLSYLQAVDRPWRRILEIGCGTGYLTRLLRQAFPEAHLTAIDLALPAIREARQQLGSIPRLAWVVADGEQPLRGYFDLITSNSVFQWFMQPVPTCQHYWECLNPGGWLIFATLGPDTFQELAVSLDRAARQLTPKGGGVNAIPPIPASGFAGAADWQQVLVQTGFASVSIQRQLIIEAYPTVMDFLKAIQAIGATNPSPSRISRGLLVEMMAQYESAYRVNGAIPVTYELLWARARKI